MSDIATRALYIDLLKRALANTIYADAARSAEGGVLAHDAAMRESGSDWPLVAHTMVGMQRLDNLARCCATAIEEGIRGDFIETGVWRGGATVLMRGVLKAYGDVSRIVWVADSFEGLPTPDAERYPADGGDRHHELDYLRVSEDQVRETFRRYGLLDDQVRFLKGWFRDTLPRASIERLAVLRLDGDMYESTQDALDALYPKLSTGGFAIVDDYGAIPACKAATDDYRRRHGVREPMQFIDWTGVFWRKVAD
ncbi:MAG TPA: TylF/MycF family methyltransferase [Casimicrobiaceae bacterium]|nr:TylF/MycF family methyltransferase [Casimicrobiaceae bacterium]